MIGPRMKYEWMAARGVALQRAAREGVIIHGVAQQENPAVDGYTKQRNSKSKLEIFIQK